MKTYYFGDYVNPETIKRQESAKKAVAKVFEQMFPNNMEYDTLKDFTRKPTYYEQWQQKTARRTK